MSLLSQSLKFIVLMTLRMLRRKKAEQNTFNPIHMYPALRVEIASDDSCECCPLTAAWMSAQAATMELRTMIPNERRIIGVTLPPNQRTSPYAVTIIDKFLKMVYTGTERN